MFSTFWSFMRLKPFFGVEMPKTRNFGQPGGNGDCGGVGKSWVHKNQMNAKWRFPLRRSSSRTHGIASNINRGAGNFLPKRPSAFMQQRRIFVLGPKQK